jgi:hypothetical protein
MTNFASYTSAKRNVSLCFRKLGTGLKWLKTGSELDIVDVSNHQRFSGTEKFHGKLSIYQSSRQAGVLDLIWVEFLSGPSFISLLPFHACLGAMYRPLISPTLPASVHRKVFNARKTTTN